MKCYKIIHKTFLGLVLVLILFILSTIFIANYSPKPYINPNDSVIVILGAGYLKNRKPVTALEKRLIKGIFIWQKLIRNNKDVYIIVSGRKEEVLIMKEYLKKRGIPNHYIISDTLGNNTRTTIKNAYKISAQLNTKPIFISQGYHIPRIILYAHSYGYNNVSFVATDRVQIPFWNILFVAGRELLAICFFPYFYITKS